MRTPSTSAAPRRSTSRFTATLPLRRVIERLGAEDVPGSSWGAAPHPRRRRLQGCVIRLGTRVLKDLTGPGRRRFRRRWSHASKLVTETLAHSSGASSSAWVIPAPWRCRVDGRGVPATSGLGSGERPRHLQSPERGSGAIRQRGRVGLPLDKPPGDEVILEANWCCSRATRPRSAREMDRRLAAPHQAAPGEPPSGLGVLQRAIAPRGETHRGVRAQGVSRRRRRRFHPARKLRGQRRWSDCGRRGRRHPLASTTRSRRGLAELTPEVKCLGFEE